MNQRRWQCTAYQKHHIQSFNEPTHAKIKQTSTTMNHSTISIASTSVSSNSSNSMHSNLDVQSPLIHITNGHTHNGHNRTCTPDHSILKSHQKLQSNYYNTNNQGNSQRTNNIGNSYSLSHTNPSIAVNISPKTDANNCKQNITSRTVLQVRELGTSSDSIRWPNVTISANVKLIIIDTKSEFDNKGFAGNIIHAIATSNFSDAGALVVQAICIHILKRNAQLNKNNENKEQKV